MESLVCWSCGAILTNVTLPLSRYAQCHACGKDLYVCRMCRHFDAGQRAGCRDERAEPVRDPVVANFCDWFVPNPNAYKAVEEKASEDAWKRLEALFGEESGSGKDQDVNALDELFGNQKKTD